MDYIEESLSSILANNLSLHSAYEAIAILNNNDWKLELISNDKSQYYHLFFTKSWLYPFVLARYKTEKRRLEEMENIIIMNLAIPLTFELAFDTSSIKNREAEQKTESRSAILFENLCFQYPNVGFTPSKFNSEKNKLPKHPILMFDAFRDFEFSFDKSFSSSEKDIKRVQKATIKANDETHYFYFTCNNKRLSVKNEKEIK